MENRDKLLKKIEERFLELVENSETDPQMKKEVMGTISKIEGAASIIDLFTVKMIKAEVSLLDSLSSPSDEIKTHNGYKRLLDPNSHINNKQSKI